MTTFCWLPPESVPATCSMPCAAYAEPAHRVAREPRPRRRRSGCRSARVRPSSGRVTLSRDAGAEMQALRLAVLGDEGEAELARVARRADVDRLAVERDARRRRGRCWRRRASRGSRCGRSRAGRRCRGSRRRAGRSSTPSQHPPPAVRVAASTGRGRAPTARRAAVGCGRRRPRPGDGVAADHRRDERVLRLISAIGAVTTWRPSRSTVTRSASCMTSSMRCEM